MEDAITSLQDILTALQQRRELYNANTSGQKFSDSQLKNLDSSMKRNTALLRKLRQISEDTKQSILADIVKVNQSKVTKQTTASKHRRRLSLSPYLYIPLLPLLWNIP